jgi:hypothetical protein
MNRIEWITIIIGVGFAALAISRITNWLTVKFTKADAGKRNTMEWLHGG